MMQVTNDMNDMQTTSVLESRLQELEEANRRLQAVLSVAQIVASTSDLNDLLAEALRRLLQATAFDAGSVFLLDSAGNELELWASVGLSAEYVGEMSRLRIGRQVPGRVVRDDEPIVVTNAANDRRLRSAVRRREEVRSYAAIPLRTTDQVLGVLDVFSRRTVSFRDRDVDLLTAIGSQIVVAVQNAHLYQQTRSLALAEERNWLAREIHDTITQDLVALTIVLELAEAAVVEEDDVDTALSHIRQGLGRARSGLEEARRSVAHLRGNVLARPLLRDALKGLTAEMRSNGGPRIKLSFPGDSPRIALDVEDALLRITREALQNVWWHAHAGNVVVTLTSKDDLVSLIVHDDGIGFDPSSPILPEDDHHFGIVSMNERVRQIGGTLEIETRPGYGTRISATFPARGRLEKENPTQ